MNPNKANEELKKEQTADISQLNDEYQSGKRAKELVRNEYFQRLEKLWKQEIDIFYSMKKSTPLSIFSQSKAEPIRNEDGKITGWMSGDDVLRSMQMQEIVVKKLEEILAMIKNDIEDGNEAEKKLVEYKNKLQK